MKIDWKRLFKLEEREVLGLDIGSSAVKIVQIRRNNAGYVVTAAGIVDIADGTETDKNRREINIARAIGQCLQSAGIQTRLAVCSVCGPEVAVRYFKFPSLPPEEIEGAVLLEASQVCPFNIDDCAVDYQLTTDAGQGGDNIRGVLVAATNKLIKAKDRFAKSASLDCVLIDVDGLALLNCLTEYEKSIPEAEPGRTTAILNVGSSFTNLAIMARGPEPRDSAADEDRPQARCDSALPFIRDMAYAGDDIVSTVADQNNLSTEAVRRILAGGDQSELGDSLTAACQKLIVDVAETLRYYAAQEKSAFVEKIFVCGGFALVEGFVELLDSQLPAAAVLWNPFDRIRCDAGQQCGDVLRSNGPALAVVAGLAMRSI